MNDSPSYKKALEDMYKLGYEHGYQVAIKDMQISQLEKEIKALQ